MTSFLIKEAVGNSFLGLLFGPGRYFPDDPCRGVTHGPSGPRINGSDVGVPHKYLQQHEEQMPWRFSAAGYDFPPIRYLAHLTSMGILDCSNPMLAAHQFMGMLNELSLWPWMMGRESLSIPTEEAVEQTIRMFLQRYRRS